MEEREGRKSAAEGKVNGHNTGAGHNQGAKNKMVAGWEHGGWVDGGRMTAGRWSEKLSALVRGTQPKEGNKRARGDAMSSRVVPGRGSPKAESRSLPTPYCEAGSGTGLQ